MEETMQHGKKQDRSSSPVTSPRFSRVLLHTLPSLATKDELIGDLEEGFSCQVEKYGHPAARRWYTHEVLRILRQISWEKIRYIFSTGKTVYQSARAGLVTLLHAVIRRTIWDRLTTLPPFFGYKIATVQIIAIDKKRQKILVLKTRATSNGYTLPQGLCNQKFFPLVFIPQDGIHPFSQEDAAREFYEEAVVENIDKNRFTHLRVYNEGRFSQFRCHVHILDTTVEELIIRKDGPEGKVTWMAIDRIAEKLASPQLTAMINSWVSGKLVPLSKKPDSTWKTINGQSNSHQMNCL